MELDTKLQCLTVIIFLYEGIIQAAIPKAINSREDPEPSFAEQIPNVTVAAGRDVTLPCIVENLGNYKVAWMHTDRHTLLTLHDRLITRNTRYSISHNGHRTWWLHINNVEERDRGEYMCQINTSPMKSQIGYLQVVVPPKIKEANTSSDTEVREGHDVSMRCSASGSPLPKIKWRREDDKSISLGMKKEIVVYGEYLNISKTSRLHMGAYLCIASNGVPPSVSKRLILKVNFPPMIWIPNQLVGASLDTDITLDCNLESYPPSVTYWTRNGMMLISSDKYDNLILDTGIYKLQMKLHIRNLRPQDFGFYICVAKNSLGETEGTIRLYEISRPASSTMTAKTLYASGTLQSNSENIIINTWKNSHIKTGNEVKMSELPGKTLKEIQYVPSQVGKNYITKEDGNKQLHNLSNNGSTFGSSNRSLSYYYRSLLIVVIIYYSRV